MSPRRFALLVLLGTVLMQAAWIAVVPPFRGIDEFDHSFRAAAVAHGQWEAGDWASFGRGRLVTVPADLVKAANAQCASLEYTGHDNCLPVEELPNGMVTVASSAASYPPVFYWVVGTIGRPFDGAASLYAMRAACGLLAAAFIALGAWCLGAMRGRSWFGVGLVLGLTPVAYYTTTVVAPNGVEIGAAVALWCALLGLARAPTPSAEPRLLAAAGASAVVLAGLRQLGPEFVAGILLVMVVLFPRESLSLVRRRTVAVASIALLTVASALSEFMWLRHESALGVPTQADARVSLEPQFMVVWQLQVIAAFPFRNQPASPLVYLLVGGLLVAFIAVALKRATAKLRVVIAVFAISGLMLPLLLTLVTYSGRGVIWQGRYGLPILVGLTLVASLALAEGEPPRRMVLAVGAATLAVANLLGLLKVLNAEKLRVASAHDPAWHAPHAVFVTVLVAAAWFAFFSATRAGAVDRD